MTPRNSPAHMLFVGWLMLLVLVRFASAEDWPEGYVVYEDTQSSDKHYGILVPTADAWDKDPSLAEKNYLADLQNHRLLGMISGTDYFAHQNHRALKAVWAADSKWCVVEYDQRFGFGSMAVLEPKETRFVQTDIGRRIQKALAMAIKTKDDGDDSSGGEATPYYRVDSDGKVRIRVASTTDPKEMDPKHARYGFFQGTYDVRAKKWLTVEARRLDFEAYNGADTALGDIDDDQANTTYANEENKLQSLDEKLNSVYGFLRAILPPARFTALKKEQIEWLKKRDDAPTIGDKCKVIQARIKTLQEMLW